MSSTNPKPNQLTDVLFGPLSVDFTVAGPHTIGNLDHDEQEFIPTGSYIVYTNVLGTNGTQAVVAIDNGTTGQNLATATLPAAPIATSPNASASRSLTVLTPVTNPYVLGVLPVATATQNGAAEVRSLRVNVTTAAIPALATTTRSTTANISTLTVASLPAWLVAGVTVNVIGVGVASYNGKVNVVSTSGNTFSYYNPSLVTEASTSDTAGRIGALTGTVYVKGFIR